METPKVLSSWAPRVPQHKIRQLYLDDAQAIYDDALIADVGYGLLARCESFLAANEAARGRAICPACSALVPHTGEKSEVMRCAQCGWELTWGEYFATFQHRQLSGAEPVLELFGDFVQRFPKAKRPQERVFLIDRLIHGFHWYHKFGFTRPVAVNLIEGRLSEVILFLDNLTYGEGSAPGTREAQAEWVKNSQNARQWALRPADNES
jgi:ribosomal protein L37AE/L43A